MNKLKFEYFVFLILLSFSCTSKKDSENKKKLSINLDIKNSIKYSALADEIEYMLLQTNEKDLLVQPYKFIFRDSLIFIQERFSNRIFLFDELGKFKNTIGSPGVGPHENINMDDFSIFQDTVWIKDADTGKFLAFDFDGKPLLERKSPLMRSFFSKGEGFLLSYTNNNSDVGFKIIRIDNENSIKGYFSIGEFFINELGGLINTFSFHENTEKYYFLIPHTHEIVSFNKEGVLEQSVKLDFGKHNFKGEDWDRLTNYNDKLEYADENYLVFGGNELLVTENFLWVHVIQENGKFSNLLFNKNMDLMYQFDEFVNDIDSFKIKAIPWAASNNEIVYMTNSGKFLAAFNNYKEHNHQIYDNSNLLKFGEELIKNSSDNDMTVLIKLKLK